MTPTLTVVIAGIILGLGTFAYRIVGVTLTSTMTISERTKQLLAGASVILLLALAVTATLLEGDHLSGWARPAGVAVGGILAWRKVTFVLVVVAAASVTAGLRLVGIP